MNALLRCGLRHHLRHPLQTMLTLLGIAAGVALLVAMQGAQRTAERAFDRALRTVAGNATHTVNGGPDGLPVAGYAALCERTGGRGIAPMVRAVARATAQPERTVLRVVGIDALADVELRPWAGVGGRGGEPFPIGPLMTTPGAFLATADLLARLGIGAGDALPLSIGGRPLAARCIGVLDAPPDVAAGLDDVLIADIATAQEWTGRPDRIDRLDLRLPAGCAETVLAAVRDVFGAGVQIEPAGVQRAGLSELARGFRINLTALSLLSLLVGAFLVHETMRLSVAARRPAFGVLRALGVRGAALGRAVVFEAIVIGLAGSALGALLGAFGAQALLAPLVRTLNDHYATFSLQQVDFDPWLLGAGVLLGAVVASVAGLMPALAAARVTAFEVLVRAPVPAPAGSNSFERDVQWVVCVALTCVVLSGAHTSLGVAYAGVFALVVLGVLAVPQSMRWFLTACARLCAGGGPFVRYVVRGTLAARAHLALPMAAMVLAVATTIALATLVTSFRDSVAGWLGQVLPGDVYVAVPGGVDERTEPMLPAIAAALPGTPGVGDATIYRRTVLHLRGGRGEGEIDVVGVSPSGTFERAFPLLDFAGSGVNARGALGVGNRAWVSEPLAFRWKLGVGDVLAVRTDRGESEVEIAATYRDYGNERGEVLVSAQWLAQHAAVGVTAIGLELAPGADLAGVVAAVRARAAAAGEQAVSVRAQRDLRESSLQIFDRTFAVTNVMRVLCLLVAFIGIYAAFAALQLERGAEIGLLRSLGALPSRIGFVVLGQTALLGLCAGVLALPFGALLGHVLARVVNRASFGWTLVDVGVPFAAVAEALALAVVAALLAGLQPAWRFARMRPADALREA